MAKRIVQLAQSGSNTAAPPATETSVCCSLVDTHEPIYGSGQQMSLGSEDVETFLSEPFGCPSTTATSTTTTATQVEAPEWPFLCPFCCSAKLTDPVELHAPIDNHAETRSSIYCLACRACAIRWRTAMRFLNESTSPSYDNEDTFVYSNRTSLSSPRLVCPLCDCAIPATNTESFVTLNENTQLLQASATLCHPETVRNCFTGLVSLGESNNGTPGKDFSAASTPATLYCGVCEEQKAMCMCVQCDFGLCDACHKATHSKGKFRLHEVVELDQARRRDRLKCREHAGMSLDLYCETCATCVCVTCCFGGDHRGHEVFPLADVAKRTVSVLKDEADALIPMREKAAAARTELAALWPLYESKVGAVEVDVQRCFSSLRLILQEREDALLKTLQSAAADVKQQSTQLQCSAGALADLLDDACRQLASLHESVSPATLMRVAQQVHNQQAWTLRAASRMTEEATAIIGGWKYQLGEDGVNGCRMACFDMLNAQTPNAKSVLQYQKVLADLGRLEVSAELLPSTVCTSAAESELAQENALEEEEDEDAVDVRPPPGVETSVVDPIVEIQPESPKPSQGNQKKHSTSLSSTNCTNTASKGPEAIGARRGDAAVSVAAEDDAPQLRPSHVSEVPSLRPKPSRTPEPAPANRPTEMHLTSGVGTAATGFSRVAALRFVTSTRSSVPRSLVINDSRNEVSFFAGSGNSRANSSTSHEHAALDALEKSRADSFSSASPSGAHSTNELRLRSDEAAHLVRDTMPFRVSLPQKRVLSRDRFDDAKRSGSSNSSSIAASSFLSRRALKLHRTSMLQDTASTDFIMHTSSLSSAPYPTSSGGTSVWQTNGSTRLSFFSEFEVEKPSKNSSVSPVRGRSRDTSGEEHRGTVKRKTTGLQLEL